MTKKVINRKINVLIIDDDPDVCQFLKRILSKRDYAVEYLTDSMKALEKVKRFQYQIIILDIVMPKKDGIEVLKDIRRYDSSVCVIMLSAYPTVERAFESIRKNAFDFVTKPFESKDFFEVLHRAEKEYGLVSNLYQLAIQEISTKVNQRRKERDISLRQLANLAGVSPSLVYQIEHGETAPSLATLSKIASALQTNLSFFFEKI